MRQFFYLMLLGLIPALLPAQSCGISSGKNLAELRVAVFEKASPFGFHAAYFNPLRKTPVESTQSYPPMVLLPKWSADNLPFFCKIEHDWGKNARLPLKFRLGSIEYVDWLEGKHP